MKTREAIRNRVIDYANIVWDTKRVDNLHPLVHLMIEEVCNELYLMDNKLNDIDSTILEKLIHNISPTQFNYVRPASTIMHIRPDRKSFKLNHKSEFFVKELPDNIRRKYISSVVFSPIIDVNLLNLGISHMYLNGKLWELDNLGNKQIVAIGNDKWKDNKLWIQLDNPDNINQIKDLYLYIDFPHLNDNHDYYELLPTVEWRAENKALEVEEGLPNISDRVPSKIEADALEYYKIHYKTISSTLRIGDKLFQSVPNELSSLLGEEISSNLPNGYWISLSFPSFFSEEDIEKFQILINAFPALNRRYAELRQTSEAFTGVIALPSEIGEEFLELEGVVDSNKNSYTLGDASVKKDKGIYSLEPIQKKDISDTRIHDFLELFIDVLERERTVFPKIDRDKIIEVQNSISSLLEDETKKVELNLLNDFAEVARLSINPMENASAIDLLYWTTLAEAVNGLSAHTSLMANKIPALNKAEAALLTPVQGGRTFYNLSSMKAVNRFYMTSRGRILTKHDILSFCQIEIGDFVTHLDVVRCAKISPKSGAGIINAMEVRITPKKEYIGLLNQKEVLRELKIRLSKWSPSNYNYVIKIINID